MDSMFFGCGSLEYIYISNFNTSLVNNMNSMFAACSSLKSLNLSNFDTSLVTRMDSMFFGCGSLEYIYISNFNTSLVNNMNSMFRYCSSLKSLNLSNFDTSLVTDIGRMFEECENLIYINLQNFQETSAPIINFILSGIRQNIIYCINEENVPKIANLFNNISCSKIDCSFNWREKNRLLIKYSCESNCYKDSYSFQYINACYEKCPSGTHL